MARGIHFFTLTRNGPAPVQRLEATHHSREIFGDRQITAGQLLQSSDARLSVVDRREKSTAQQLSQLPRIDPVILVAGFQQGVLPRIAHHHFRHVRHEQVIQPGRTGSLFKGHTPAPNQPLDKLQKGCRFRFQDGLHHQLANGIQNDHRNRCLKRRTRRLGT